MQHYYTVLDSMPGYLPDNEPPIFTNKKDATDYAADIAYGYRETGHVVFGSKREGCFRIEQRPASAFDLGRYVEVTDISNQVRPCSNCGGEGTTHGGMRFCLSCDGQGIETF